MPASTSDSEGAAAANKDVEIFYAGAIFGGDPAGVLRTARGHQLHVDAELGLEDGFELLAQLRSRRNPGDDLAFFFGFLQAPFPFFFPIDLGVDDTNRPTG